MTQVLPLAEFERRLQAKGYSQVGWKDVIDSCDFKDKKTGKKVNLDRERLQKIADRRNKLVVERNSVAHFCLGHTKDHAPEDEQPPVTGLATRWRVGEYADEDRTPFLEAYSWEKPDHSGVFDKYPQRSAELWLDPDDINPIALLSSTTPRRDLSMRLSKFDEVGVETSSGSIVRFCRYEPAMGERQPILFEKRIRLAKDCGPMTCKECGGKLDPDKQVMPGEGESHGKGIAGLCGNCQTHWFARQLFPSGFKYKGKSYGPDLKPKDQGGSEKLSRGGDMNDKKVKCEEPEEPVEDESETESPVAGKPETSPEDEQAAANAESSSSKDLAAKVDAILAKLEKWGPALDILSQELEAEASQPDMGGGAGAPPGGSPTAGSPPPGPGGPPPGPGAAPPQAAPADAGGEEVEPEEKGPPKRNSAGSAGGYGNTSMPNLPARHSYGYGPDPETAIRMQRLEQEAAEAQRANATLLQKLEKQATETAALRLQRMEDETNQLLDKLDRDGVTIDREYDFPKLVRLSKADREKEVAAMVRLRAKKQPTLPNDGKAVIGEGDVAMPTPIQFTRDGTALPGDPNLKTDIMTADYDTLASMLAAGQSPKTLLAPKAKPAAETVKVR